MTDYKKTPGRFPSRRNPPGKKTPTQKLADILPALCETMQLDEKVGELSVLRLWPTVLSQVLHDDRFIACSQGARILQQADRNILIVRVENATLAGELSFAREQLLATLNTYTPQTGIHLHEIRLQVASLK